MENMALKSHAKNTSNFALLPKRCEALENNARKNFLNSLYGKIKVQAEGWNRYSQQLEKFMGWVIAS
jgi:hypothetical protein